MVHVIDKHGRHAVHSRAFVLGYTLQRFLSIEQFARKYEC